MGQLGAHRIRRHHHCMGCLHLLIADRRLMGQNIIVSTEHVFPNANRAKTGMGLCGGALPKRPFAPFRPPSSCSGCQIDVVRNGVDVRSPLGMVAGSALAVLASPGAHGTTRTPPTRLGRGPPMVSKDGPLLGVHSL